ncbi:hypothetical protein CDAR_573731 [Caerostris darwini]|uniref:Uncharacterized protein n=1 Tax=Caerostris darwini TaxID=1538125 RepID=A0AAV4MCB4_9ARAC|nr:hypothetical protein CDAR_573731 [Caerostris darwini]
MQMRNVTSTLPKDGKCEEGVVSAYKSLARDQFMLCPSWAATISRFLQINMGVILLMHHLPSCLKKRSLRLASSNDPDGVFVACHSPQRRLSARFSLEMSLPKRGVYPW